MLGPGEGLPSGAKFRMFIRVRVSALSLHGRAYYLSNILCDLGSIVWDLGWD